MSHDFFEKPILNSPYAVPTCHWELDKGGQPTQKIIESRRPAEFITPIPRPKKRKSLEKQSDNAESFFARHVYFLGANNPHNALKTTLKAEINPEAWATLHSDTSRAFDKPESSRIVVKVINHLGDEVMKVFRL